MTQPFRARSRVNPIRPALQHLRRIRDFINRMAPALLNCHVTIHSPFRGDCPQTPNECDHGSALCAKNRRIVCLSRVWRCCLHCVARWLFGIVVFVAVLVVPEKWVRPRWGIGGAPMATTSYIWDVFSYLFSFLLLPSLWSLRLYLGLILIVLCFLLASASPAYQLPILSLTLKRSYCQQIDASAGSCLH